MNWVCLDSLMSLAGWFTLFGICWSNQQYSIVVLPQSLLQLLQILTVPVLHFVMLCHPLPSCHSIFPSLSPFFPSSCAPCSTYLISLFFIVQVGWMRTKRVAGFLHGHLQATVIAWYVLLCPASILANSMHFISISLSLLRLSAVCVEFSLLTQTTALCSSHIGRHIRRRSCGRCNCEGNQGVRSRDR